jgi:hypothetical protein
LAEEEYTTKKDKIETAKTKRLSQLDKQGEEFETTLDQKLLTQLVNADQRSELAFAKVEERIHFFIEAKKYNEAEEEKRRLTQMRKEAKQKREFEAKQSQKVQQRVAKQKAKRDSDVIEQTHGRKVLKLAQERDKKIEEQQRLFSSQLRTQLQRFVSWINQVNPHGEGKRELLQKFEKTARVIVAENHLEELFQ